MKTTIRNQNNWIKGFSFIVYRFILWELIFFLRLKLSFVSICITAGHVGEKYNALHQNLANSENVAPTIFFFRGQFKRRTFHYQTKSFS